MKTRCKCHGVSGSCSMKTCWRVISTMREIGQILKSQHINALRVSIEHRSIGPAVLRTVGSNSMTPMLDNHLVYIKTSINYCIKNRNYTIGRECAPRDLLKKVKLGLPLPAGQINKEAPVCEDICCGQLFRLDRTVSSYYCNCRFIWCCDILCDICTATVDKYYCISWISIRVQENSHQYKRFIIHYLLWPYHRCSYFYMLFVCYCCEYHQSVNVACYGMLRAYSYSVLMTKQHLFITHLIYMKFSAHLVHCILSLLLLAQLLFWSNFQAAIIAYHHFTSHIIQHVWISHTSLVQLSNHCLISRVILT